MVHFHYFSKGRLKIRIVHAFDHSDTERIALILEGSLSDDFDKKITFQVETDLPKDQMDLLGDFCKHLPYDSHIDLKYPLLVW